MKTIYLYAKQHNITGMRYFGKTMRDPYKYNGSGSYWTSHIKKHGADITTTWVMEYTDKELLTKEALFFSKVYNISESDEWANLKPENGLDGATPGDKRPGIGGVKSHTEESKKLIKAARAKQVLAPWTDEMKQAVAKAQTGRVKSQQEIDKMKATKALNPRKWTDEQIACANESRAKTRLLKQKELLK